VAEPDDRGFVFTDDEGNPLAPDSVSKEFKAMAREAGLVPIRLHEGRHTAATPALEAELDVKVVSVRVGHANTTITRDRYRQVRPEVLDAAADRVPRLVQGEAGR
jgi:integrase